MARLGSAMELGRRWQRMAAPAWRWAAPAWRWAAPARHRLGAWGRGHWLISVAIVLSLAPRVLAALAFRPALFTPDSFSYLSESGRLVPGQWHPAGYPMALWMLRPFHSLLLVTSVQHLMGVATAVMVYAVLRRRGLPAWGAVLATCPVLFDARQITLESYILPDTLYAFLITLAVALLMMTGRKPVPMVCALAGLLLAGAALTRGNGAPEMVAVLAVLLLQWVGWRAVTAAVLAFAIPVLGYMGVFAARHGDFALTNSDGIFLWSRTTSFANCAVIKPPATLLPLCPGRRPGLSAQLAPAWSVSSLLSEPSPSQYLWAPGAWWRHDAHPGFNAGNNKLAMSFALSAIRAQPVSYLRSVGSGLLLAFVANDRSLTFRALHFTPVPEIAVLDSHQLRHLRAYGHVGSNTHPVQPYAYFLFLYQEPVFFPGIVFLLLLMAGLTGLIMRWRHGGGPPALPWAVAAVGVVLPIAVHQYHYRYMISVVPVACLAAGLAFARHPTRPPAPVPAPRARTETGDTPPGAGPDPAHVGPDPAHAGTDFFPPGVHSDPASLRGQLAELEPGGDTARDHQVPEPAPNGSQADVELPGDRLIFETRRHQL